MPLLSNPHALCSFPHMDTNHRKTPHTHLRYDSLTSLTLHGNKNECCATLVVVLLFFNQKKKKLSHNDTARIYHVSVLTLLIFLLHVSIHPFSISAYPALRAAGGLEPIPAILRLRRGTPWTIHQFSAVQTQKDKQPSTPADNLELPFKRNVHFLG